MRGGVLKDLEKRKLDNTLQPNQLNNLEMLKLQSELQQKLTDKK